MLLILSSLVSINIPNNFIYLFHLNIYPSELQESDGGAIYKTRNYPDLLPEMQDIAVRLKFFILVFSFIEI